MIICSPVKHSVLLTFSVYYRSITIIIALLLLPIHYEVSFETIGNTCVF